MNQDDFEPIPKLADLSPADSLRIMRELAGLSRNELADRSGTSQSTVSALENGRINLGVDRAKTLARALRCHPAVLVFPGWNIKQESAA